MKSVGGARVIGVASAAAAVGLGVAYMALAGAPPRLLLMNLAALGIGLVLLVLVDQLTRPVVKARGPMLVGLGLILLATTLSGTPVNGATRWVSIAGLAVQPSLVLVPLLLTGMAAAPDRWAASAVILAIGTIALQPDRSLAAMLLFGSVAIALRRGDRMSVAASLLAAVGLSVTLLRLDTLPAVPFVDQILYTAFDVHPMAGVAVWAGTLLLFVPAFALSTQGYSALAWTFAAVWGGAVLAAALANYPTPLVGYGGSAIIGYLLSLAPLGWRESSAARSSPATPKHSGDEGGTFRFA